MRERNAPDHLEDVIQAARQGLSLDRDSDDGRWLAHALACFPVPTVVHVPYVLKALRTVVEQVPWASQALTDETFKVPLGRLERRVEDARRSASGLFPKVVRPELDFQGPYLRTKTIHDADPGVNASLVTGTFRMVFITCCWRWIESSVSRENAIDILGAAIRAESYKELPARQLYKIAHAESLGAFIDAAAIVSDARQEGLRNVWRQLVEPELRGIPHARRPHAPHTTPSAPPPPPVAAPPVPAPHPAKRKRRESDEDDNTQHLLGLIRRGTSPRPGWAPSPLPGELPEEVTPTVEIYPACGGVPASRDDNDVERYRVQQAIWNRNRLLLPNHPDALPLPDYAKVVQGLVTYLESHAPSDELAFGNCALLVTGITGRTTKTLTALEVVGDERTAHDPERLELLLAEGALRLSPFWQISRPDYQPSFFHPTDDQKLHLEETGTSFQLPLIPAIIRVLRLHEPNIRALATTPAETTAAWIREAARSMSDTLNLPFAAGQLRSSCSVHLFESCRDMAAVQLICADTLGQSVAPLAYYAPRVGKLADIYTTLQHQLIGGAEVGPPVAPSSQRVGSQLIVRKDSARDMARATARLFHHGVEQLVQEGRIPELHTAMVNHLAGMLLAVATHRPAEALFKLTLADIWIDGDAGAALFRDKIVDAAHDPRLVALPRTVCRQLQAYLDHLVGLSERFPAAKRHIYKVLQGRSPLLFALSKRGEPDELTLAKWAQGMPKAWHVLPMNWGRHWTRTYAEEYGIRPELVSMQLGHLEVADYPFSGASPTEPWLFVQTVAPAWEKLALAQGWRVVNGLTPSHPEPEQLRTPLHSWNTQIRAHLASQREWRHRWKEDLKSRLRSYRDAALETALRHHELVSAGVTARFASHRTDVERHALKRADFERIRDELYEAAGDDLALAIAQANAVCHIAHVVNRCTRQLSETPAKIHRFRRPVDNAFVPGMMEAVRQMHMLREHVRFIAPPPPTGGWNSAAYAAACAAMAMVLFGYCSEPEQILGALGHRNQLVRSATLEDTVLVPWGEASHQVLALRGIAAAVFSRFARKFPSGEIPAQTEIEHQMAGLLPVWAIGNPVTSAGGESNLLARLCETAAVANRYELSPAARMANDMHHGSTPAHQREQLALLDGDPAGTLRRDWEAVAPAVTETSRASRDLPRKGNARSQYRKLCAVFPGNSGETLLPLTQVRIPAHEAASPNHRHHLAAEIEAQLAITAPEYCFQPIVRALDEWVLDMLVNGTPKRPEPAFSTVETYLTRIGGALVHTFGQSSLDDVTEVELEDAYLTAVEAKGLSRSTAAAAILAFHRYAVAHAGFPEADLSNICLYLEDDRERLADARLILPSEREAILTALDAAAMHTAANLDPREVRTIRMASQALPPVAFKGLRRSEGLGIQLRDVSTEGDMLRIRIRPNASRRIKTVNARRTIEIPLTHSGTLAPSLGKWVDLVRARLKARRVETAFVFAESDDRFDTSARNAIAERCLAVCREVTGHAHARLHAFRHLVAMECTTPVFLCDQDLFALSRHWPLAPVIAQEGPLALPRDLQAQVITIGHGDPRTSLTSYHHLPWLLRSRSEQRMTQRYANRATFAPLLGVTLHALDWLVKQHPGRPKVLAWLDAQVAPRAVPPPPNATSTRGVPPDNAHATKLIGHWTAGGLGTLLQSVARIGNLEDAMFEAGHDTADALPLRLAFHTIESRLGARLLLERQAPTGRGHPRRCLRPVLAGKPLEALWDRYDHGDDRDRLLLGTIADALFEYLEPHQKDRALLPVALSLQLQSFLLRLGIPSGQIVPESTDNNLVALRILRRPPSQNGAAASGNAQRYIGLDLKRILLVLRVVAHQSTSEQ